MRPMCGKFHKHWYARTLQSTIHLNSRLLVTLQPSCIACTKRNIKCVWIFDRARCEFCSATSKHLKCSFGDTLRWHRACSQLPDHEPSEIRKVFEQTSLGNGNSDPFWYEKIIDGHRSPYVSSSDSSDITLLSSWIVPSDFIIHYPILFYYLHLLSVQSLCFCVSQYPANTFWSSFLLCSLLSILILLFSHTVWKCW